MPEFEFTFSEHEPGELRAIPDEELLRKLKNRCRPGISRRAGAMFLVILVVLSILFTVCIIFVLLDFAPWAIVVSFSGLFVVLLVYVLYEKRFKACNELAFEMARRVATRSQGKKFK